MRAVATARRAMMLAVLWGVIAVRAIARGEPAAPDASAKRAAATMVVIAPVVDVRAHPAPARSASEHDPNQETQLLYGEHVRVLERQGAWARIEAQEQPEFSHHARWEGYPGWVPLHALLPETERRTPTLAVSVKWAAIHMAPHETAPTLLTVAMGTWLTAFETQDDWWHVHLPDKGTGWIRRAETRSLQTLAATPTAQQRQQLLAAAQQLLDDPYRWGGRSPYRADVASPLTGVDCSALVQLAYRTIALSIPRDAHEQHLRSRSISRAQLQPGDLVFLSKAQEPQQIVHVLLYEGNGRLIEGPGTGLRVREISWVERFGRAFGRTEAGQAVNGQTLWFGAYLP